MRIAHPQPPIQPLDTVKIQAQITDEDYGVDNATLYYGVGENSEHVSFTPVGMLLIDGDIFNGTYEGEIPPQANGSKVWYYVATCDRAGNSFIYPYFKYYGVSLSPSYLTIAIRIRDINMAELSAALEIYVSAMLPSRYQNEKLVIDATNTHQNYPYDYEIFFINMSESLRYWYQGTLDWAVHLIGNPNDYPFDNYFLNLSFTILWENSIDEIHLGSVYLSSVKLYNEWQEPEYENKTITTATYPQIFYNIPFKRSSYATFPFELITLLIFSIVGASLILNPEKLESRLSIYTAIFIFVIGFFFQIKENLPSHIGFTNAERILLSLTAISAFSVVGSTIISELQKWYKKRAQTISKVGDFILILLSLMSIILFISTVSLPPWYSSLIIIALFYGYIIKLLFRK